MDNSYTDFLFVQPSFLSGTARVLDLGATFDSYNFSDTPEEADRLAIMSDFYTIGNDLRIAIENYANE